MEEGDDDGGGCEGERPTEEARSGGGQEEGGRACSGRGSVEGAEGHDGGQAAGDGGKGVFVFDSRPQYRSYKANFSIPAAAGNISCALSCWLGCLSSLCIGL